MTKKPDLRVINSNLSGLNMAGADHNGIAINKRELQLVMGQIYGMLKQKMGWHDHSITFLEDGVYFDFKKHARDDEADLTIIKRKRPRGFPPLYQVCTPERGIIDQGEDLKTLVERLKKRADKLANQ